MVACLVVTWSPGTANVVQLARDCGRVGRFPSYAIGVAQADAAAAAKPAEEEMEVVKKKRTKKLAVPAVAKTAGLSERELQARQPALPGYRVRLGQGASSATVVSACV